MTRVRFMKSAQRLGFSLDEIGELLQLEDGAHCDEASLLASSKLKDVREKLADLIRIEAALSNLARACTAANGKTFCPVIASLKRSMLALPARWHQGVVNTESLR